MKNLKSISLLLALLMLFSLCACGNDKTSASVLHSDFSGQRQLCMSVDPGRRNARMHRS